MTNLKNNIEIKKILLIIFYSFIYSVGLYFFMNSANLLTTGLAGISQIIEKFTTVNYGTIYILINIPGIIVGFKYLGKKFTMYSIFNILTVSFLTFLFSSITVPEYLNFDLFIDSVFGGILMGYSVGKLLKIGASSGGTDFLAMYLLKYKNIDFQRVNWIINFSIIVIGIFVFGLELGLYTIISLYIRNSAIEQTFTNPQSVTLFIIGSDLDKVSDFINDRLRRGTTIIKSVEGGYTHDKKEMIMTTLNKYEYSIFINNIFDINPDLFINMVETDQIIGNYKKTKEE